MTADDHQLCLTVGCGKAFAVFRMRWPGAAPLAVCFACALRAASIAQTMGFVLDMERIEGASIYGPRSRMSLRELLEVN